MANRLFMVELKKIGDGTTYEVVDVQLKDVQFAKSVEFYLTTGDDLALLLKKNLIDGNTITIPVATVDADTGDLTIDDFTVDVPSDLQAYKNKKKQRISTIFSFYLASTGGLTFFQAMASFSILASHGYFITEENREEKYLEIINTGDQDLIAALEEYLDAYDSVSPISAMYSTLKQAKLDIDAATDEAGVDAAVHMFDTAT